jgi:hypothetical protein
MMILRLLMMCLALWFGSSEAHAQETLQSAQNLIVKTKFVSKTKAIVSGKPADIGVLLTPREGWHIYYKDPGEAGLATAIEWVLSDGFTAGDIRWPAPTALDEDGIKVNAYKGEVLLPVTIQTPADLKLGSTSRIGAKVSWLVCKDICIPESTILDIFLPVADKVAVGLIPLPVRVSVKGFSSASLLKMLSVALSSPSFLGVMETLKSPEDPCSMVLGKGFGMPSRLTLKLSASGPVTVTRRFSRESNPEFSTSIDLTLTSWVVVTVQLPKCTVSPLSNGRKPNCAPTETPISARDGGLIVTTAVSLSAVPYGLVARTQ